MKTTLRIVAFLIILPFSLYSQTKGIPSFMFERYFNGGLSDDSLALSPTSLSETENGNLALTAFGYNSHGYLLLSPNGTKLSSKASTNALYRVSLESAITLPSNNVVFLGIKHAGLLSRDGFIFGEKVGSDGQIIESYNEETISTWIKQNYINSLISSDNSLYILGVSWKEDTTTDQAYLPGAITKVDSNGYVLWIKFFLPTKEYYVQKFYAAVEYGSNSLIGLAVAIDDSTNRSDYRLIQFDSSGNELSDKVLLLKDSLNYKTEQIIKLKDNNLLVTGYVELGKPRTYYGFLSKFTPSGDSIWTTYVQQDGYTILQDVCELPNGDLVACGQAYNKFTDSLGNPKENNDFYLAVFDKNGTLKKDYRWGTDFKDYLSKLLLLRDGNIAVCGTTGIESTPDNTYIRGGEAYIAKIQTASLSTPREVSATSSLSVYPNPSSEIITVSGLTKGGSYTIVNILGLEVANGSIGKDNATLDVRSLPNGIYYFIENRSGTPDRVPFVIAR